ncbi:MAG: M23 family metallopeptidase, partial [Anaerolineales bacterium]|nr:M23 family metallopeptidase [Anaerolineales bacterium]
MNRKSSILVTSNRLLPFLVVLPVLMLQACGAGRTGSIIEDVQVMAVGAAENDQPEPTAPPEDEREEFAPLNFQELGVDTLEEAQEAVGERRAPLKFTFPTAMPPPISAWRPPLYEIPWAPTPNDHFYFSRPIAADEINWPLEDYRYGGVFFDDNIHTGVDIPAPQGTPVIASAPGKVVKAGYGVYTGRNNPDDPYGLAVVIRHDFGYEGNPLYTVYGHLSQIDVLEGQRVDTGELLGLVGQTGFTTGPHLHFEVRIGENRFLTTRNPELWVAPPLGWGVLVGRVEDTNGRLAQGQLVFIKNQE